MRRVGRIAGWALFGLWMVFWALLLTESDPRFPLAMASRFVLVAGGLLAAAVPVLLARASWLHLRQGEATPLRAALLVVIGSALAVLLFYLAPMATLITLAGDTGAWGLPAHDLDHFGLILYMLMMAVPGLAVVLALGLLWAGRRLY